MGDEYAAVVFHSTGEGNDIICLTDYELGKMGTLKSMKEDAEPAAEQWKRALIKGECGDENLAMIPGVAIEELKIKWPTAKKMFTFLQSEHTRLPNGTTKYELPKPMTSSFAEMKLTEKISETETETYELPAGIKSFFAFQVNAAPGMKPEEREEVIQERNNAAGDAVAGEFGSLYLQKLGKDDEYLNQADQNQGEFSREVKVNNPRELIKIIEAANKVNYQELLNFSSAKLASGIRINDLWRLRALFGFSPTGDYTDKTYYVVQKEGTEGEKVVGYFDLLKEHQWFDPKNDKNALYVSKQTVREDYMPAAVDAAYTKIHDNKEVMTRIINESGDFKTWINALDSDKKEICVRNELY